MNVPNVFKIQTKSNFYKNKIKEIKTKRNYNTSGQKRWNFSSLVNDEIGFARIDKITSKGIKPTYDIEVEKYHNFVANGIIAHNSGTTMLYPTTILKGKNGRADHLSIAFAGKEQNQDVGAKIYHLASNTSSLIISKSISK